MSFACWRAGITRADIDRPKLRSPMLSLSLTSISPNTLPTPVLISRLSVLSRLIMPNMRVSRDAARLIRAVRSRYRVQAFLIMGYHFFIESYTMLDIFVVLFILVSNRMNEHRSVPSQLLVEGIRFLVHERIPVLP
jgi:hypothetical protein